MCLFIMPRIAANGCAAGVWLCVLCGCAYAAQGRLLYFGHTSRVTVEAQAAAAAFFLPLLLQVMVKRCHQSEVEGLQPGLWRVRQNWSGLFRAGYVQHTGSCFVVATGCSSMLLLACYQM
jgi:hypothetical protein